MAQYQALAMGTEHDAYPVMGRVGGSTSMDGAGLEQGLLPEPEWKPGKQEYAVMITLGVISLMVALDATILVSVLPTLAVDLGGSSTDAFWAGTSYLLSSAVCQPFIAALSDIFGRKETLFTSIVLFTLGTILCAPVAKDFTVFFVGRAVQGIGGGGIITMGQVIFADIVPLRQRPKYFSIVLVAWALGSVLGPLIGGLFVEHATWAWCFYINLPFCAMGLVLVPIYVKLTTVKSSLASKLSRVDWVGGFFFIGGMTSFLVGISWAGIQYEWNSVQTIAPIIVGVVSIAISVLWEIYYAAEPFLRPRLFNSPSALATYACALFQGFILFCTLYYVPFYFTAIKFEAPTQTGLNIFPVTCLLLPGSIVISLLTTRTGRYRWAIWSGWVVTAIGCGLLVLLDAHTTTPVWAVILAIFGIGNGILLTAVNVGIQAVSRVEDAGRAAAMYAFMRGLGMSIGVAVGGTVFQNVMSSKLEEVGLPKSIAPNSEAFVHELSLMDPADPTRLAAIEAYLAGFHGVYWTITAAAIASFLISLVIKRHSMDKSLASDYTLKGGRAPIASANGSSEMMIAGNYPPPIMKSSPFGSSTRSSSEETLNAHFITKPSRASRTRIQARDGEGSDSGAEATESDAIVAYYIQPGGRIVPVDILPDSQPSSEASSMREVHLNTQYYGAAGVVGNMNDVHHPSPAELWLEQERAAGRLQSDSGEYEAAGAHLAPVWMHGR